MIQIKILTPGLSEPASLALKFEILEEKKKIENKSRWRQLKRRRVWGGVGVAEALNVTPNQFKISIGWLGTIHLYITV